MRRRATASLARAAFTARVPTATLGELLQRMVTLICPRSKSRRVSALPASIVANPLSTQWLPAINFPGADPGIVFNNFSPRLGLTYDFSGAGNEFGMSGSPGCPSGSSESGLAGARPKLLVGSSAWTRSAA